MNVETVKNYAITGIAVTAAGLVGYSLITCYRETGSISLTSLTRCFLKGGAGAVFGLTKDLAKEGAKGAKWVYRKGLKPVGKATFNKVLKPGYKQLKHLNMKKLEKASNFITPKPLRKLNPLDHRSVPRKVGKKTVNLVKKGFKKLFR